MGEDTSDTSGFGKNREPVGFGRVVSRDIVVELDVSRGTGLASLLETEERIDSKAWGESELVCGVYPFAGRVEEDAFSGSTGADWSKAEGGSGSADNTESPCKFGDNQSQDGCLMESMYRLAASISCVDL
jgi:hypothetical protein